MRDANLPAGHWVAGDTYNWVEGGTPKQIAAYLYREAPRVIADRYALAMLGQRRGKTPVTAPQPRRASERTRRTTRRAASTGSSDSRGDPPSDDPDPEPPRRGRGRPCVTRNDGVADEQHLADLPLRVRAAAAHRILAGDHELRAPDAEPLRWSLLGAVIAPIIPAPRERMTG